MNYRAPILITLLALLAGCQPSLPAIQAPFTPVAIVHAQDVETLPQAFLQALQNRKITLKKDQLQSLRLGRYAAPSGEFAARPVMNLDAASNLTVHFNKHRNELHPAPKDEAEYLARAIKVAKGENGPIQYYFDSQSFSKNYQSHVVRWNPKTKEFTAIRDDGAITTFFINKSLTDNRFILIP